MNTQGLKLIIDIPSFMIYNIKSNRTFSYWRTAMIREAAVKSKNGRIYTGQRHQDIYRIMPDGTIKDSTDGFITSDGRFVTREEAAKIALACGQITEEKSQLISEDLY